MSRFLVPSLAALAFGLLQAVPAFAGIIVTTSPTAPSMDLLASHSASVTNFAETWVWTGNVGNDHRDLGQSFLLSAISDRVLDMITVRVREFGTTAPNASYALEIWTFSDRFDGSGNMLVSSQADVLPSSGALGSQFWTFDLEDVILTQGQQYGFIFAFNNGPDNQRFVHLVEDYNSGYSAGRAIGRNGTPPDWSVVTNDLEFYLQGGSAVTAVPEPSAVMLFGLGGIALMFSFYGWRRPTPPDGDGGGSPLNGTGVLVERHGRRIRASDLIR